MKKFLLMILLTIFLLLPACQKHPLQQLGATSVSQKVDDYELKGGGKVDVDILFVVDNSGTMAEEQEKLVSNVENFMKKLKRSGEKTNYHIGVITTSVYDENQALDSNGTPNARGNRIKLMEDGKLTPIVTGTPSTFPEKKNGNDYTSCDANRDTEMKYLSNFKIDDTGKEVYKYADNPENNKDDLYLKNTINCLGTDGALIERSFDSIEKAIKEHEVAGFFRDSAKLMIIIISDEDDCSTGIADGDLQISYKRYFDCVEQSDRLAEATEVISDKQVTNKQNKVKSLQHYIDVLVTKKGDISNVGFAAIVGPGFCWDGDINSMGGIYDVPSPALNCTYVNQSLQSNYENYSTCDNGANLPCLCDDSNPELKCTASSFFTSCFNDIATGLPNEIAVIDTEHQCSATSLHGKCADNKHCEVTVSGVKCVADTCSADNPKGTCPANKACIGGICTLKERALYPKGTETCTYDSDCKEKEVCRLNLCKTPISTAIPGRRYLDFYQKLYEAKENSMKDLYKYSICLEDFGSPLSLIGAQLAEAKCEYDLQSKTDDPCNLVIKIFAKDGETLDPELDVDGGTTLNNPWTYTIKAGATVEEGRYKAGSPVTPELLLDICNVDNNKPFNSRDGISQYLEKVSCKSEDGTSSKKECLRLLFPNVCPEPGSKVQIFYGVTK